MKAALSVVLALLLAACSDSTGPGGAVRVETSQSVYPLPGPTIVQFSVRNTSSFSVVLPNCGQGVLPELQRREGALWVNAGFQACPALAIYAPITLAPGETATGQTTVTDAGQYRIRVAVAAETGAEFSSYAVSPDFVVRWLPD